MRITNDRETRIMDDSVTTLEFMKEYKYSPFRVRKGKIIIPDKYLEVLSAKCDETDFENLPATEFNWQHMRKMLIPTYWLDQWYQPNLPTPATKFYDLDEFKDKVIEFDGPKFVRLNSLSSKEQAEPVYSSEIVSSILKNKRCHSSLKLAEKTGSKIYLAVRDWIDVTQGIEFRCFVYDEKLRAISINDEAVSDLKDEEIVSRVESLLDKILYDLPNADCVMDVWLHDFDQSKDLVIEFNSYGFYGNAGIDTFDWVKDGAILYGFCDNVVVRR